jgi:hypothetical protein
VPTRFTILLGVSPGHLQSRFKRSIFGDHYPPLLVSVYLTITKFHMAKKTTETKVDKYLNRFKNNPFTAFIIVFFIIVSGIATFSESINKIVKAVTIESKDDTRSEMANTVPLQIQLIVSGKPLSQSKAEFAGSSIQLFEKGWMIARFFDNTFYAVQRNDKGSIQWIKSPSNFIRGAEEIKDTFPGNNLLRLGFRKWYSEDNTVRDFLGKPVAIETRAWLQFQKWDNGLLVYGLPSSADSEPGTNRFLTLSAIWLNKEDINNKGDGKYVLLSEGSFENNVSCSCVWYPANKDRTLPSSIIESLKVGKCENVKSPVDLTKGSDCVILY